MRKQFTNANKKVFASKVRYFNIGKFVFMKAPSKSKFGISFGESTNQLYQEYVSVSVFKIAFSIGKIKVQIR